MRGTAALLLAAALLTGCGPTEEDITRLACIKVLRWNHDPAARSEIYRSTLDLYRDAQAGEVEGEATWRNLVEIFTDNDQFALSNWEESEPCQTVEQEILEEGRD